MLDVQGALREVRAQLVAVNHHVSQRLGLRDGDLECLDLVSRHGPVSPSALAKLAGLHPATMTGVLDRLERAGWVGRERDQRDRRAVVVRVRPERGGEVFRHYGAMRAYVDDICADYDHQQLTMIAEFVRRVADAGERASAELARE
ncbi:MAG TPA: MarR family transcriptional regulator [Actinophytocola sp.]|nr:MarR family transcriptional regulator [Actinophytocola sp.]